VSRDTFIIIDLIDLLSQIYDMVSIVDTGGHDNTCRGDFAPVRRYHGMCYASCIIIRLHELTGLACLHAQSGVCLFL
jgi:hypothetical protein